VTVIGDATTKFVVKIAAAHARIVFFPPRSSRVMIVVKSVAAYPRSRPGASNGDDFRAVCADEVRRRSRRFDPAGNTAPTNNGWIDNSVARR
jgi:hypothetical protein